MDRYLLGLDFETQSEKPKETNVTEVGASLYRYTKDAVCEVDGFSALCYDPSYPPQTKKIVELTGITDEMLKTEGKPVQDVFRQLLFPLIEKADVVFCHKVSFDKTVLDFTSKKFGLVPPEKEYVCTLSNFPWPERITCKKLSHIAYEHGILVDPATLHRAKDDVDLMMRLILEKYDLEEVLNYARKPWAFLRAFPIEPWKDGETQTTIAKSLGFNWQQVKYLDEPKFPKMWVTRVKFDRIEPLKEAVRNSASPFRVLQIEGIN